MSKTTKQRKTAVQRWLSKIGRKGGSVTSDAKARAAAINGAKGGRPKGVNGAHGKDGVESRYYDFGSRPLPVRKRGQR